MDTGCAAGVVHLAPNRRSEMPAPTSDRYRRAELKKFPLLMADLDFMVEDAAKLVPGSLNATEIAPFSVGQ